LVRRGIKITSIDVAYFAAIILTVISFVTKTPNINAFHFVFVAVGMFVVYFVIRFENSDEILLQSKIIYSVVGIGFIVVVIGLIQFVMGKPLVSTFGRTSYLGCFMAMNVSLAFGLVLATTESKGLSKVKGRKVEGEKEIPLAPFMKGGIIITKDQIRYLS